ncbi:MAG: hypothetical protein IT236_05435 [Bacteroidia bacterium]|nr:hypothetical protein [Bacteroidia bacterium]
MKNKKWLLLLIIVFPSVFWLILETSTINSRRLPFYGPKKVVAAGDTTFYKVTDTFYNIGDSAACGTNTFQLNDNDYPLYAIIFISEKYRADAYRLTGLWEYLNYSKSKIEHIPFVLVTENKEGNCGAYNELKKLDENNNVRFLSWNKTSFDSLSKSFFNEKPYYIDYSFFVLVDANRHVRGYYDGRYVSEVKRLIGEYQHLRLKEEKQKLIQENEIRK